MGGLSDRAMIAKMTVGLIALVEKDRRMTAKVHKEVLNNSAGNAGIWQKIKINRDDVAIIFSIAEAARVFYREMTRPFGDDGGRLLPVVRVFEFSRKMGEFERRFDDEVVKLAAEWPNILERQRERLKDEEFRLTKYPTAEQLVRKFRFSWALTPVPDWAAVHDKDHVIFKLEEDMAKEIIEKAREDEKHALMESTGHLWTRLFEAVDRMKTICLGDGRVFKTLLSSLERENALVADLNFTNDQEIVGITREIHDKLLGWTVKQLRKDKVLKMNLGLAADNLAERIKQRIKIGMPV